MFRNYFLINIFFIILISFLGYKLYGAFAHNIIIPSEPMVTEPEKKDNIRISKATALDLVSIDKISELDLFRPSRTPAEGTSTPVTAVTSATNPPKLFGTMILNDKKTAILADPESQSTKIYGINDSVSGFVISEIMEDKIVFVKDGEKVEVRLREDKGIKPLPSRVKRPAVKKPARKTPRKAQQRPQRQPRPRRTRRPAPADR
jgi:type II secretory pathway component PulC